MKLDDATQEAFLVLIVMWKEFKRHEVPIKRSDSGISIDATKFNNTLYTISIVSDAIWQILTNVKYHLPRNITTSHFSAISTFLSTDFSTRNAHPCNVAFVIQDLNVVESAFSFLA